MSAANIDRSKWNTQRDGDESSKALSIVHSKENPKYGGVAQLGEHLPCKQGVMGSNPIISTSRQSRPSMSTQDSMDTPRDGVDTGNGDEEKWFERDEIHRKLTWAHSSGG